MAGLLRIPETACIACVVLKTIWYRLQSLVAFSSAFNETLKTLVTLLHEDPSKQAKAIDTLCVVIVSEKYDTVLSLVNIWKALLLLYTQPAVQIASIDFVSGLIGEVVEAHAVVSELWKIVLEIFVHGKDDEVRLAAGGAIRHGFSASFHVRSRIASISNVCSLLSGVMKSKATNPTIRLFAWAFRLKIMQITGDENPMEFIADVGEIIEDVMPTSDSKLVRCSTLNKF
jgi:hypothetical protein